VTSSGVENKVERDFSSPSGVKIRTTSVVNATYGRSGNVAMRW
jgi:hypothetical protein